MLKAIKEFFDQKINPSHSRDEGDLNHRVQLATAALLLEVSRADFEIKDEERDVMLDALQQLHSLTGDETRRLLQLAEEEAAQAVSDYEFTSLIHSQFTMEQKIQVIEALWRVVYADRHLEKYEEALVRKLAELLYIPHSAFIAAKHRVVDAVAREGGKTPP